MAHWADQILGAIDFGDQRLNTRLRTLVSTLAERPEASIPLACGSWAATLAAYRFFDHEAVTPGAISASLAEATVARCEDEPRILAVQDTTSVSYSTHQHTSGLGPLEQETSRGVFVHTTLAVSTGGVPLGVLDQQLWARDPEHVGTRHQRKRVPVEGKESAKWLRGLQQTRTRLGAQQRFLLVADREADVYELFALAQELDGDWLIRARHDRALINRGEHLRAAIERAPVEQCVSLTIPRQGDRPFRQATVEVRRSSVLLVPPARNALAVRRWWAEHPEIDPLAPADLRPLRVGVVLVTERDTPEAEPPVRWLLLTNCAVDTPEAALACVEHYRHRWLVERFHYVLKSGCQVERLQLARAERLEKALALYSAVAWVLLYLTHQARLQPNAPCTTLLDEDTWQALHAVACPSDPLPTEPPDLHTAVVLIARLGGFLGRRRDGEPGVKTVWRGLTRLSDITMTWRVLSQQPTLRPTLQAYV